MEGAHLVEAVRTRLLRFQYGLAIGEVWRWHRVVVSRCACANLALKAGRILE
jgi:hypothetical protein